MVDWASLHFAIPSFISSHDKFWLSCSNEDWGFIPFIIRSQSLSLSLSRKIQNIIYSTTKANMVVVNIKQPHMMMVLLLERRDEVSSSQHQPADPLPSRLHLQIQNSNQTQTRTKNENTDQTRGRENKAFATQTMSIPIQNSDSLNAVIVIISHTIVMICMFLH